MSPIEAVVFDLDGVLVDSEHLWDEVREELARERGGRWHDRAQADMMGMSSTEWSRYMHDVIGLSELAGGDQRRGRRRGCSTATRSDSRSSTELSMRSSGSRSRFAWRSRPRRTARMIDAVLASGARALLRGDRLVRGGRPRQAGARRLPRGRASTRRPPERCAAVEDSGTASAPHTRRACVSSRSRTAATRRAGCAGARRRARRPSTDLDADVLAIAKGPGGAPSSNV